MPVAENTVPVEEWRWKYRPIILYNRDAGDAGEAQLQEQLDILKENRRGLEVRDMIVVILRKDEGRSLVEDEPVSAQTSRNLAERFFRRIQEEYPFSVVLVGKDGSVKLRRNEPVATDEVFALIDAMPMRKREMAEDQASE